MTQKDKDNLQTEINKIFNETIKYMQFRFQELANTVMAIPVTAVPPVPPAQEKDTAPPV